MSGDLCLVMPAPARRFSIQADGLWAHNTSPLKVSDLALIHHPTTTVLFLALTVIVFD